MPARLEINEGRALVESPALIFDRLTFDDIEFDSESGIARRRPARSARSLLCTRAGVAKERTIGTAARCGKAGAEVWVARMLSGDRAGKCTQSDIP
jgi:hypothetical protein